MIRALALALLLGGPALAQDDPQISVALDPQDPVPVGTRVEVSVTVLVPTYMPQPPVWPDLQIADAITRLPERATHPVTRRIGTASWSGLTRTWEIIPQRAADFDLGAPEIAVTYADPDTNAPVQAAVPIPGISFTATVPPGAEGMDPFLAASSAALTARLDGLSAAPKPGDAFTLTLTTTADGPPAMLLPPLVDRLATLPGLRAYPRQPDLADGPPATRTEAVSYVIEQSGHYELSAMTLDWWNSAISARETATTDPIAIDVPAPPGWRAPGERPAHPALAIALAVGCALAVAAAIECLARRRERLPAAPSERSLYRALRAAVRHDVPAAIRPRLATWLASLPAPPAPTGAAAIEVPLRSLERFAYGPDAADAPADGPLRRQLLDAIAAARSARLPTPPGAALPALNPAKAA